MATHPSEFSEPGADYDQKQPSLVAPKVYSVVLADDLRPNETISSRIMFETRKRSCVSVTEYLKNLVGGFEITHQSSILIYSSSVFPRTSQSPINSQL